MRDFGGVWLQTGPLAGTAPMAERDHMGVCRGKVVEWGVTGDPAAETDGLSSSGGVLARVGGGWGAADR